MLNAFVRKLIIGGRAHDLANDVVSVGRAAENTIQIDDPSVSSRHAELRVAGDNHTLRDLQSTNGTMLNGVSVIESALHVGDRIRFGKVEAVYEAVRETGGDAPVSRSAGMSAVPSGFTNASPFAARRKEKDSARTAIFAAAIVAFLLFLSSIVAVLTMHAPAP